MASNYGYEDQARSRHQYSDTALDSGYTQSLPPTTGGLASAYSILGSGAGHSAANGSPYAQAMQTMQGAYGNRALQRYIGQPVGAPGGAGALPGQGTSTISGLGGSFTMPGEMDRRGWGHPPDGDGGYAFWHGDKTNVVIPGLPFGIPMYDFEAGMGWDMGGETMIGGTARGGSWQDEDGTTRFGGQLQGELAVPDLLGIGYDGLEGNMELSAGSSGFTFGAGLTLAEIEHTVGEDKFSGDSTNEGFMKSGISEGPSLGVSGHWGDSDGDGYRELGFGFDALAFSFDLKSEDPLRTVMDGIPGVNLMTGFLPEDRNLTWDAIGTAGSAMETASGWLESGLDAVSPIWMGETGGLDPIPAKEPVPVGGGSPEGFFPWW